MPKTPLIPDPNAFPYHCYGTDERVLLREQRFPTLPLALPENCPLPDEEGITQTVALYQSEFGREITREEAREALGPVMRFLWAINLPRWQNNKNSRHHNPLPLSKTPDM
jgi:hypothetical protein